MRRNNRIRAAWAATAIEAFAKETRQDTSGDMEHDKPSVVGDLLANIRHYCDVHGMAYAELDRVAHNHYTAEQDDGEDSWELTGQELFA